MVGVGLNYQPELRPYLQAGAGTFDHLEVVPDTIWNDHGPGSSPRHVVDEEAAEWIERLGVPVVLHSIGLSIGSAHRFDDGHVRAVAAMQARFGAAWHSDHLAWCRAVGDDGVERNANLTLPIVHDEAMLRLIAERVGAVQRTVPVPFLLENNVHYFDPGRDTMDEATFLRRLVAATGCGVLLDLHNLHVDVRNRGVDVDDYLARFPLDAVVELHVAGGIELDGAYLDAHSGAAPDAVLDLLAAVVPRCPALRAVTFELFGTWFGDLGASALRRHLRAIRAIVDEATVGAVGASA